MLERAPCTRVRVEPSLTRAAGPRLGWMLAALVLAPALARGQTVVVDRDLPDRCAGGTTVEVRLDVRLGSPADLSTVETLLVTERLPGGWTVVDGRAADAVGHDGTVLQWLTSGSVATFTCFGGSTPDLSCTENADCRCLEGPSCPAGTDADAYCRGTASLTYTARVATNGSGQGFDGEIIAHLRGQTDSQEPQAIGGDADTSCSAIPVRAARSLEAACRAGESLSIDLTVTPEGNEPASAVVVREVLPAAWELVSAVPAPTAGASSGMPEWALGTLAGATTVHYTVRVPGSVEPQQHLAGEVSFRAAGAGGSLALEAATIACGSSACASDCNGDGAVAINELITGVNIALGKADLVTCPSTDSNGDREVAINELIDAVKSALDGCSAASGSFDPSPVTLGAVAGGATVCPDDPHLPTEYGRGPGVALTLGRGFDPSNTNALFRSDCFVSDGETVVSHVEEPEVVYSQVEDREQLYKELGIDVRASARYAFIEGSASFGQQTRKNFSEDSLVFTVRGEIGLGEREPTNLRLSREMQDLMARDQSATVAQRCGSMYVARVREAVRFAVVYQYSNLSQEERRNLISAFSAAYGGGGVEAAWHSAVASLSSHTERNVSVAAAGGESIELTRCILGAGEALSQVKRCIDDYLSDLATKPRAEVNAVPVTYRVAPISQLGVDRCVLAGLTRRDRVLGDIFLAREDAVTSEKRLSLLADEVDAGLVDGPDLAETARDTIDQTADYMDALDALASTCIADQPNAFTACESPAAAGLVPPALPLELRPLLFDRDQWSFYRWCRALRATVPEVAPDSAEANTVSAMLGYLFGPGSTQRLTCLTAQYELDKPNITQMILEGFPSYHSAPLQRVPHLRTLSLAGNGDIGTGTLVRIEILQRFREQLETLRVEKLGVSDDDIDTLLRRDACAGGTAAGQLCTRDEQCPGSTCVRLSVDEVWPSLMTLSVSGNRLESLLHEWPRELRYLNLSFNRIGNPGTVGSVRDTFAPLMRLRSLDVRHDPDFPLTAAIPPLTAQNCNESVPQRSSWGESTENGLALMNGLRNALLLQQAGGRHDVEEFRVRYRWSGSLLNVEPEVGYNARYCNRCQTQVEDWACNTLVPTQIVEPSIFDLNFVDPGPMPAPLNSAAYRFGVGALCLCGINGPN